MRASEHTKAFRGNRLKTGSRSWLIMLPLCCLLSVACGSEPGKPASSNRPYEVLLDGDREDIIYGELTDTVPGLPQPELSFDVTIAKDSAQAPWQNMMRNIVRVVVDRGCDSTWVDIKRNVYAKPQTVITVTTPSAAKLKEYVRRHPGSIRRELEKAELISAVRLLKSRHNETERQNIKKEFGIDLLIPPDMKASKHGKDFVWLSNNANEGLMNVCVYRVRAGKSGFRHVRDSIMRRNIPGERDGMYMETTRCSKAGKVMYRGLWDVHGDAMGGPFIACEIIKPPYIIYVEGFVYSPEGTKRNKIRRLEAVLLSAFRE